MGNNNKRREFGRWRVAGQKEPRNIIIELLSSRNITFTQSEPDDFKNWMIEKAWENYHKDRMNTRIIAENAVNALPIKISNAQKGQPYESEIIAFPCAIAQIAEIELPEGLGLEAEKLEDESYRIKGTPTQAGDFYINIRYIYNGWLPEQPMLELRLPFAVNCNPRDMWNSIPTPSDISFPKPDQECEYVKVDGSSRKSIVAASNRGRSHAHDGRPRDDHFQISHIEENDWYILAVADGAGSAQFSRKGSEVACRVVTEYCKEMLNDATDFEAAIRSYNDIKATGDIDKEADSRKRLGNSLYSLLAHAAHKAYRSIGDVATANPGTTIKDYATTLLLAVCKKFDFGWFIASFWVGDGAIGIYNAETDSIEVLGTPDEGEYSGQTRFLTMPEIFRDHNSLYQRLRFKIVDDFTALFLMTDGVSDPMFGSDANLKSPAKWREFWDRLMIGFPEDGIGGVELTEGNEAAKEQLLSWLDFWKPGEHDDRTIAILY